MRSANKGKIITRTIATVRIDSLEQAEGDPYVHGDDVEVLCKVAVDEWADEGARSKDEHLGGMRVFCGEPEGRGVLVVDFVNVLVERADVERAVGLAKRVSCMR